MRGDDLRASSVGAAYALIVARPSLASARRCLASTPPPGAISVRGFCFDFAVNSVLHNFAFVVTPRGDTFPRAERAAIVEPGSNACPVPKVRTGGGRPCEGRPCAYPP